MMNKILNKYMETVKKKRIVTRIGNVFCAENNPKESTILYSKSPGKRNGACFGLKILIPGGAG